MNEIKATGIGAAAQHHIKSTPTNTPLRFVDFRRLLYVVNADSSHFSPPFFRPSMRILTSRPIMIKRLFGLRLVNPFDRGPPWFKRRWFIENALHLEPMNSKGKIIGNFMILCASYPNSRDRIGFFQEEAQSALLRSLPPRCLGLSP